MNILLNAIMKNDVQTIIKEREKGVDVNSHENENYCLISASKKSYVPVFEELLKFPNINLEVRDKSTGDTPLILATIFGNIDIVKKLLESGADINAKNNKDMTPLLKSLVLEFYPATKLFLNHGVDITCVNIFNKSVVTYLCQYENIPMIIDFCNYAEKTNKLDFLKEELNNLSLMKLEKPQKAKKYFETFINNIEMANCLEKKLTKENKNKIIMKI